MSRYNQLFPDSVYINGAVLTMHDAKPKAEAVAVMGDRIVAVGSNTDIGQLAGPATRVVDMTGKTMLPGLIEPHNHFSYYGLRVMLQVDLSSPPRGPILAMADLIEALKEKAASKPAGQWVLGYNYDDTLLAERRHPTRYDLDKVSADHPIFIYHVSGHISVANTRALQMAGVTKYIPQPEGGIIRRDSGGLEPDGVLEERPAQALVFALIPQITMEQRLEALSIAAKHFLRVGITSIGDAGVGVPGRGGRDEIIAYQKAISLGIVPIRTMMMIHPDVLLGQEGENASFLTGFGDNRLKIGPVKIIGDGSIQAYTGWLAKPYHVPFQGDSSYCGYPVTPPDKMNSLVALAHKAGFQVAIHANGDVAIDAAIDAYRLAQEEYPRPDARHRIEHCQMVREDQLDTMSELGITPSFFVSHTYYWGDRHKAIFIGPERAARINPLKSALARGMEFSVHSDCPVTPVSPLFCVSAAVNRVTTGGEVLGPEFRLTPEEALRAVTTHAAWQSFDEKVKGSIKAGKLADFTVLAENPLEVDPLRIKDIKVQEVIIGGQSVYRAG